MPMLLQIRGHHLPGRAGTTSWTIPIEVVAREGGLDFRGAAVQGRPGSRFVYLTWGDVDKGGSFTMFRRAKLMLADVAPLITGDKGQTIVATVDLTDDCGGPRCARLRAPALRLA